MNDDNYTKEQIRHSEREIIRKQYHLEEQRGCRRLLLIFIALLIFLIIIAYV